MLPKAITDTMSVEDNLKFQERLIALLKDEITTLTKSAKFNFKSPEPKLQANSEHRSLLMKSSPQTLYDAIRRETSILLNRREPTGRMGRPADPQNENRNRLPTRSTKIYHTIKVIVPPSECFKMENHLDPSSIEQQPTTSAIDLQSLDLSLTYQKIKNKVRQFQAMVKNPRGGMNTPTPMADFRKKPPPKSLDKIVNKLRANLSLVPSNNRAQTDHGEKTPKEEKSTSLREQIINSSAHLLKTCNAPASAAPTPIPVFRPSFTPASRNAYIVNLKSKKSKRLHCFGMKLGNYMEKEPPQPSIDNLTIEQFCRGLNLVRPNDASLQRRKEQMRQSEAKFRLSITNRPMRLKRIRGERIRMPASASYKATRRVGLQ